MICPILAEIGSSAYELQDDASEGELTPSESLPWDSDHAIVVSEEVGKTLTVAAEKLREVTTPDGDMFHLYTDALGQVFLDSELSPKYQILKITGTTYMVRPFWHSAAKIAQEKTGAFDPTLGVSSKKNLYYVAKDVMSSWTLNNVFLEAAEFCMNAQTDIAAWISRVRNKYDLSKSAIDDVVTDVSDGYSRYGYIGMIKIIASYMTNSTATGVDERGHFIFQDNSQYSTVVWMGGFVDVLVNTLTTVVSVVATAVSRVAGVIVAMVSQLAKSIVDVFKYKYNNETLAKVNTDSLYKILPYGLFQYGPFELNRPGHEIVFDLFLDSPILTVDVPGAKLFLIKDGVDYNADGVAELITYYVEAHLSVEYKATHAQLNSAVFTVDNSGSDPYDITFQVNHRGGILTFAESVHDGCPDDILQLSDVDLNTELAIRAFTSTHLFMGWLYSNMCELSTGVTFHWHLDQTITDSTNRAALGMMYICLGYESGLSDPWTSMTDFLGSKASLCPGMNGYSASAADTWYQTIPGSGVPSGFISWDAFFEFMLRDSTYDLPMYRSISACSLINSYYVATPKYSRNSFISQTVLGAALAAVGTAACVVSALYLRKASQKRSVTLSSNAESAWSAYGKNPTEENYEAYRKAVFKNNVWATITGGTKLSQRGYWDQSPSTSPISNLFNTASDEKTSIDSIVTLIRG